MGMENTMKAELLAPNLISIGGDKLRVEAPVKIRDEFELREVKLVNPKTGQKSMGMAWKRTKRGKKLFSKGEEPHIWNFYAWERQFEKQADGSTVEMDRWRIKREHFNGTRNEAVAACIAEFGGAI